MGECLVIKIIVLAKLVPDIRHIPEDAWDTARGTLRRNRLKLVPNALDDRALALALRVREQWGGRITVISMGPHAAEELCSRALAFGADDAVLVSDSACAGSDTLATARVLAAAITSVAEDPMLLLAGVQSPDGDTAQVPVQIASFLELPVVPYVISATVGPTSLELQAIAHHGTARTALDSGSFPVMVTCTDQLPRLPFHASLEQVDRATRIDTRVLTAADLHLEPAEVGLAGSATRVVAITGSPSARRAGTVVRWPQPGTVAQETGTIIERIASVLSGDTGSVGSPPGDYRDIGALPVPDGEKREGIEGAVWVLVDSRSVEFGLVSEARRIARAMGCECVACSMTPPDAELRTQLARAGADSILTIDAGVVSRESAHDSAARDPTVVAFAVEEAVRGHQPAVLLVPATPEGRVMAPYLAARLGAGLTADCTGFEVRDFTMRRDGKRVTYPNHLHQVRPALGGNILATIVSPTNTDRGLPQIATVRPGVFPPAEWPMTDPPAHRFSASTAFPGASRLPGRMAAEPRAEVAEGAAEGVSIESCTVLVSVGRGVGGVRGIEEYAQPLADALRNRFKVATEVSASRAVVDAGNSARERQVGQTGKTVRPDIYIALGISGAIQHRAGMEDSGMIIAINVDEDAPIRSLSDIFIHGRVEDVVPQLTDTLGHTTRTEH